MTRCPDYFHIQAAIGFSRVNIPTNARIIADIANSIPSQLHKYLAEMLCVGIGDYVKVSGHGMSPREITRKNLPDDNCVDCTAAYHCILLLIKQDPANRKLLPDHLRDQVIVE